MKLSFILDKTTHKILMNLISIMLSEKNPFSLWCKISLHRLYNLHELFGGIMFLTVPQFKNILRRSACVRAKMNSYPKGKIRYFSSRIKYSKFIFICNYIFYFLLLSSLKGFSLSFLITLLDL